MITDEMLRTAAAKSCESYVSKRVYGYDSEKQHEFSHSFERKIKRLKRKADHPVIYRALRWVASIILALLIGGSAWLTFDVEARAAFWGWINEVYGTFFVYRYSHDYNTGVEQTSYRPTWIPDGYTEIYSNDASDGGSVLYENECGEFLQFQYVVNQSDSNLFIDNTDTVKYETTVNGHPADYLKSESAGASDSIVWANEYDHLLYVAGMLDEDELIRIAQSVEIVK